MSKQRHLFRPMFLVAVCGLILGTVSVLPFVLTVEAHQATTMPPATSTLTRTPTRTTTPPIRLTPQGDLTPTPLATSTLTRTPTRTTTPPIRLTPQGHLTATPPEDTQTGRVTPTAISSPSPEMPSCSDPKLEINYSNGAPGSSFNIYGKCYPANTDLAVRINGFTLNDELTPAQAGSIRTDAEGRFTLQLTTSSEATPGFYAVLITDSTNDNMLTIISYVLSANAPVRAPEGASQNGNSFQASVSSLIPAQTHNTFLPIVQH